jgi:hyperosmotically inducible protein
MVTLANPFTFLAAITICALPAFLVGCNDAHSMPAVAPSAMAKAATDGSMLTVKIKTALLASSDLENLDIRIQIRNGEVVLRGFADDQVQIDRSIAVVKRVAGVGKVINRISVRKFT